MNKETEESQEENSEESQEESAEENPEESQEESLEEIPEESSELEETPSQKLGAWIILIPLIFFSMETAPGWGIIGLNWDLWVFLTIVGVFGCIGGALYDRQCRLAGLAGGAVIAMGALGAAQVYLHLTNRAYNIALVFVSLVGAIPGVGVYFLAKAIFCRK